MGGLEEFVLALEFVEVLESLGMDKMSAWELYLVMRSDSHFYY